MLVNMNALRKSKKKMVLSKGIYLVPKLYKFNFNILLDINNVKYVKSRMWDPQLEREVFGFGVCDNYEQVLERFPQLATSKEKKYVVALSKVSKGIEGHPYGWRWRKWGRYIGTQKPTTEYLYDEPLIQEVYTFVIYEIQS